MLVRGEEGKEPSPSPGRLMVLRVVGFVGNAGESPSSSGEIVCVSFSEGLLNVIVVPSRSWILSLLGMLECVESTWTVDEVSTLPELSAPRELADVDEKNGEVAGSPDELSKAVDAKETPRGVLSAATVKLDMKVLSREVGLSKMEGTVIDDEAVSSRVFSLVYISYDRSDGTDSKPEG